jgi:hypothetical protein
MSWIYIGVGLTVGTLLVCAIWTMFVLAAVPMPAQTALTLKVNASQWWWAVRYESDQPAEIFSVANEIHIPVGRPVRIELTSSDVIHSFWIPQLGGKMDMIPGQTNVTWLQADSPGVYHGECGEFAASSMRTWRWRSWRTRLPRTKRGRPRSCAPPRRPAPTRLARGGTRSSRTAPPVMPFAAPRPAGFSGPTSHT